MAISTCGLPASGGPCKRSPGHGGLCYSGVQPIIPPPVYPNVNDPGIIGAVSDIFADIATDYFMRTGLRRIRKHVILLLVSIVLFTWLQFGFDLYILFR